jgi:hypothetical protein
LKTLRAILLSAAWLLIVLIAYLSTHKPFGPEQLLRGLALAWQFGLVIVFVSLAGGLGYRLTPDVDEEPILRNVLQATLGLGLLGLGIFLIGSLVGVRPWLMGAGLLAAIIALRKAILSWLTAWKNLSTLRPRDLVETWLALPSLALLVLGLLQSAAPPLQWDTLTYHLTLPKAYLLSGSLERTAELMFWGMPQQVEMLNLAALAFGGESAATLLGWAFGFLTLAGALSLTSRLFGLRAGWAAIASLLGGYTLSAALAWGYNEWPVMLFSLSMLACFSNWQAKPTQKTLALAAIFAGFALGTKYTAGLVLPFGLLLILYKERAAPGPAFRQMSIFAGLMSLTAMPWLARNWLSTGNPIYPLLFPAAEMTAERIFYYSPAPWGTWLTSLFLPWQATILGADGGDGFSAAIGPLLLGFSALAWIGFRSRSREQKTALAQAAIVTVSGFLFWAALSRTSGQLIQTRLFVAFFPAWALLAAAGFEAASRLKTPSLRFERILLVLALLPLAFNLLESLGTFVQRGTARYLLGLESAEAYRSRNTGTYENAMQNLAALPPGSKTLLMWETRGFACWPACDPDEMIDRWYIETREERTASNILAGWQEAGYTHILLNQVGKNFMQAGDERFQASNWQTLDELLTLLPPPLAIGESYRLYEIPGQ